MSKDLIKSLSISYLLFICMNINAEYLKLTSDDVLKTPLPLPYNGSILKESDVDCFLYGNHGMESYANGIAVSPSFAKKHPEAVKGFIRATYKAARDMVLRPEMAIAAVKKFQPLVQNAIEADRLRIALDCCILTPNVKKNGYGSVDMARLQRSINQAAAAYKLKNIPKAADMFDASFLPAKADRFIHK